MNPSQKEGLGGWTVVEQKFINGQNAYLFLNGKNRKWIKFCDADQQQTNAMMKFEYQKNNGIPQIYLPGLDYNPCDRQDNQGKNQLEFQKYNLRERELLTITQNQFYGLTKKQENIDIGDQWRPKSQLKKEEKKKLKREGQKHKDTRQNSQQKKKPMPANKAKPIKKLQRQKHIEIIDSEDSDLQIL